MASLLGRMISLGKRILDLNDISDVDTSGVNDNDVLTYDSATGTWSGEAGGGEANPTQVSSGEIAAGTETGLRLYSPADVKSFVDTHGGGGGGAVDSVNSQTGAVTLDADDIDDSATTHRFATAAQLSKLDAIEANATADQSDAEIETAYNNQVGVYTSQSPSDANIKRWSPNTIATFMLEEADVFNEGVMFQFANGAHSVANGTNPLDGGAQHLVHINSAKLDVTYYIETAAGGGGTTTMKFQYYEDGSGWSDLTSDVNVNLKSTGGPTSEYADVSWGLAHYSSPVMLRAAVVHTGSATSFTGWVALRLFGRDPNSL